jgi:hypothetical protein
VGCLEIFLLIGMCRYLLRTAAAKGRTAWPYAVLMVVSWFVVGIIGAVAGYLAEGAPQSEYSVGAVFGYVVGVAIACGMMALLVNLLPDSSRQYERSAMSEQEAYIQWRKRQGAKKAQLADEGEAGLGAPQLGRRVTTTAG